MMLHVPIIMVNYFVSYFNLVIVWAGTYLDSKLMSLIFFFRYIVLFKTHYSIDVWLTVHHNSVWIKDQLDVTFCILYFSSNSCSTSFGQPCADHQVLTTA